MRANDPRPFAPLSLLAAAALAITPLAQGCAAQAGPDPDTGEILLLLQQSGPHGEIYHLGNATFDVIDATGALTTVDGSGSDPQVVVALPPGLASVQLRPGWTLERSDDGGASFHAIGALLGSPNPNIVRVLANQPVFMEFDFLIRQANGTLAITLGVVTDPRELAGGVVVQTATGTLAPYAALGNNQLDFAIFFQLFSLESVILEDGTRQHVYIAFGQQASFGPVAPNTGGVAAEFYNDHIGTLAGPIATELGGGFLTYTVAAKPDATFELSGSYFRGFTNIAFGPHTINAVLPGLDPDGFPTDSFFYDDELPFTQISDGGTLSGLLRMRHLLPAP
ncbi:MAG TPA: hypothetical protein VK607_15275 [Kofleriaceae bacterium]|nr:hypothetical protein [Kofleriaceae bacterium]